jgi:FkbM family methyltransferase
MSSVAPVNFETKFVSQFKNHPDGEKELVREFFRHKKDGFFVDVGANHPTIESQTWHLEQLGWQGLLLEPQTEYCNMLKEARTGKIVQAACSSPENHNKKLQMIVAGGHSTLNADPIAVGTYSEKFTEVICKTLDSILEENAVTPGFDFLSIDIEGHEMEMFKGFSLKKWLPKLVLLEDHVTNHEKHNHMIQEGYQLVLRTGLNSWYVPASLNFKLSMSSKFEFYRKYWLALPLRKIRYGR